MVSLYYHAHPIYLNIHCKRAPGSQLHCEGFYNNGTFIVMLLWYMYCQGVFRFASAIYCSKCTDILESAMTVIFMRFRQSRFLYEHPVGTINFTAGNVEHGCFHGNFIQLAAAVLIHADTIEFFHLPTVNNAYQLRKRAKLGEKNPVTACVEWLTHQISFRSKPKTFRVLYLLFQDRTKQLLQIFCWIWDTSNKEQMEVMCS